MTLSEAKKEILQLANNAKSNDSREAYFAALYFLNQVRMSDKAKEKIEDRINFYWDSYKGWDGGDPELRGKPEVMGMADGLEEALSILEEVKE